LKYTRKFSINYVVQYIDNLNQPNFNKNLIV